MIMLVFNPSLDTSSVTHEIEEDGIEEIDDLSQKYSPELKCLSLDVLQYGALLKLLNQNSEYRRLFLKHQMTTSLLNVTLRPIESIHIDYKFCDLVSRKLLESIEREDALHWLSTLGGAFSNLGEHSVVFAKKAGDNAFRQMRILIQAGDPSMMYHCWIFMSMSLMQQKRLRASRKVLEWIYERQKSPTGDPRVVKMCLGCWARLKYHWINRKRKNGHQSKQLETN